MATFKVGQRVRIVRQSPDTVIVWGTVLGREATVTKIGGQFDCFIVPDGDGHEWEASFASIAPLVDPAADAFLARMKKLGKEPINDAPKVTERIAK